MTTLTPPARINPMLSLYSEMVEMLGQDDARAVVHRLGGKRIYVPASKNMTRNHKLAKALGYHRACRFADAFEGDKLDIPLLATIRRAELIAFLDRDGNISVDEMAWLTGTSSRHVRRILSHPLPKV